VRALRKRIERGQLAAERTGRWWRISHEELVAAGLCEPVCAAPQARLDLVMAPLQQQIAEQRAEIERLQRRLAEAEATTRADSQLAVQLEEERQARHEAEAATRSLLVKLAAAGEHSRLLGGPSRGA
jgi:hypothetical protein